MNVNEDLKRNWSTGSKSPYASGDDDRAATIKKFLLRNLALWVVGLLFVVVYFSLHNISESRSSELAGQRNEIVALRKELSLKQDKVSASSAQAIEQATGGMSAEHKAADDKAMTDLMTKALTWNGLAAYLDRREQIMKDYGFAEDSQFMSVFMPGEQEGAARTAPSGKQYSSFDADMSSQFVSLSTYVTAISADVYSYFALVELRVKSSSGATSSTGQVMMTYDMISGKPSNLDAYTVPGGVDSSG